MLSKQRSPPPSLLLLLLLLFMCAFLPLLLRQVTVGLGFCYWVDLSNAFRDEAAPLLLVLQRSRQTGGHLRH